MRFTAKYSYSNFKQQKSKSVLFILSIVLASFLFLVSFCMPTFIKNYNNEDRFRVLGTADITASSVGNSLTIHFDDIKKLVDSNKEFVQKNIDYVAYTFSFYTVYKAKDGKDASSVVITTTNEEIENLGGIKYNKKEPNAKIGLGKVIISEAIAEQNGYKVGDWFYLDLKEHSGYYPLKIIGIAKSNNPFFNGASNSVVIAREQFNVMPSNIFNIAFIKSKQGVDSQLVLNKIKEIYPSFSVRIPINEAALNQRLNNILIPYFVCALIGILFCILIIYMTANLIFSKRLQEFSTLKTLGLTNKNIAFACMAESLIYGFIGGLIATILGGVIILLLQVLNLKFDIFYGISIWTFVFTLAFAVVFAVICSLIPAIKSARHSIRQEMIKRNKFSKKTTVFSLVLFAILIASAATIFALKLTIVPMLALVLFFVVVLILNYLVSAITLLFAKLINKISSKKAFNKIYTKNNIYTNSTNMVSRIMFFGVMFVVVLSIISSTITNLANNYGKASFMNVYIDSEEALSEEQYNYITATDNVEQTRPGIIFGEIQLADGSFAIFRNYSFTPKDFQSVYAGHIENENVAIEEFSKVENGVVVNKSFLYSRGWKIGDELDLMFNNNKNKVRKHKIVGYITTQENAGNQIVFNYDFMTKDKLYRQLNGSMRLYLYITADKIEETINKINKRFEEIVAVNNLPSQISLNESVAAPVVLIKSYSIFVALLSFVCMVVGSILLNEDKLEQNKLLFLQGISEKKFIKLQLYNMFLISSLVSILGLIVGFCFKQNLTKMLLSLGVYLIPKVNLVVSIGIGFSWVVISLMLTAILAKSFYKKIKTYKI